MPGGRPPTPVDVRLWARMGELPGPDECWHWPGNTSYYNYGVIRATGRGAGVLQAHIVAYESVHGTVPEGLHLDHTCHNADLSCPGGLDCLHRRCVNPNHLEPVTQAENNRRMQARIRQPDCPSGHPMYGDNLYVNPTTGARACKECRRGSVRKWYSVYGAQYRRRKKQPS